MFRSPTHAGLPPLSYLINDIPAGLSQIASHLGIAERTLKRYMLEEQAPRPIMLALFWESKWGRSAADCEATNHAGIQAGRAHSLEHENEKLRRQISQLEALLESQGPHAANTPFFKVG